MNVIKNSYQYEPFKDELTTRPIRLLRLFKAASFTEDINCELFNTTLDAKKNFEALSYTWGDLNEVTSVILDGQIHKVTKNLILALRHVRYQDRERILWVDALCIDQGNVEERNRQVAHMGDIYREGGAKQVVVWLGEIPNALVALKFCETIKRHKEEEKMHLIAGASGEGPESCRRLFYDPPWWSRVWILQEVIHSGDVLVYFGGGEPVSLDEICSACNQFISWERISKDGYFARVEKLVSEGTPPQSLLTGKNYGQRRFETMIASVPNASDVRGMIGDLRAAAKNHRAPGVAPFPPNLSGLLMKFREQKATDARDLIYAYLGMAAPGSNGTEIAVDYRHTKELLYTRLARSLLKKVLIILLWVEAPNRPVEPNQDLPSWVPDYTIKQTSISRLLVLLLSLFKADVDFPPVDQEPRFRDLPDSKILTLRGIYVAVVTGIYDKHITNIVEHEREEVVRLMTYDQDPDSRNQKPADLRGTMASEDLSVTHNNTSWGPCHTAIGDIIIVAAGCRIPFVLRRTEDEKHLFVGGCCLIDAEPATSFFDSLKSDLNCKESGYSPLMFGSACKGLSENWKVEEFQIC